MDRGGEGQRRRGTDVAPAQLGEAGSNLNLIARGATTAGEGGATRTCAASGSPRRATGCIPCPRRARRQGTRADTRSSRPSSCDTEWRALNGKNGEGAARVGVDDDWSQSFAPGADRARGCASVAGAMTKFSVIVPTYNERRNIGILYLLLRDAFAHPSLAKDEFEIVIVDDNSPDGTQDVVRALQKTYKDKNLLLRPRPGKLGLGTAYVHGLNHASGEYVIIMDADLSHHPRAIPEFVAKQRDTDADVVTGTRYVPGGGVHGWDTRRKLTSRVANYLAHVLLSPGVSDLTGSFRLYRRDALERMVREVKSKGYVFQMEIIVRCKRAGLSVEEVPITFVDRVYGASKLGGAEIVGYLKGLIRLTLTT